MVCVSIRKAIWKKYICFFLLILAFIVLTLGCDPYYNEYPYNKESEWICTNPSITLSYKTEKDGTLLQEEILVWEESTMEIDLLFQADFYVAYPADSTAHDDRLFSGSWHYRNGNLILNVDDDFLFDHQFDVLEFIPQPETLQDRGRFAFGTTGRFCCPPTMLLMYG